MMIYYHKDKQTYPEFFPLFSGVLKDPVCMFYVSKSFRSSGEVSQVRFSVGLGVSKPLRQLLAGVFWLVFE